MALAFGCLAAACSPLEVVNLFVPRDSYEQHKALRYGPNDRHRLDLYLPRQPGADGTVVVFIYGGGWRDGARERYVFAGEAFAARGYVTVVPDYRLFPEARFPVFVEDVALALAWVWREIAAYGGKPTRIVLAGHSAGAHTAALLALDHRYLNAQGVPPAAILGVIGLAGPYSFDPTTFGSTKKIFATAVRVDDTRPIAFARADAPPMLLLHGLDDAIVQPKNSADMADALRRAGAQVRYVPLENVGHPGVLLAISSPLEGLAPVMPEASAFLKALGPAD